MNEQTCQTFKAVAEYKSVSQAARHLNLSQSAVSQHIQHIEAEYNTSLFVRTSQGMVLTDVGELVYRYVTDLLLLLDASRNAVEERLHNRPQELSVGASLTVAEYLLPLALSRIDSTTKHAGITVYMANSQEIADRILGQDVELGLIEAPIEHPELISRVFLHEELQVVVSATHPWASRSSITLEELRGAPAIIREPGSGTRMAFADALHHAGLRLNDLKIQYVLGTTQAIKAMIAGGHFYSVLSPLTISPHENGLFACVAIDGLQIHRNFYVIHRPGLNHPLATRLVSEMRRAVDVPSK